MTGDSAPGHRLWLCERTLQNFERLPVGDCSKRNLICGGDHNFSILEVESSEDLCLTPQTGAVFSRKGTEEGRTGEEAVQQRASPAVDLLGGNPQAPQNVAGESPRHAPQPVAAASRPSPPSNDPATVLSPENKESAFLGMEKALSTSPPESLSINKSEDSISEEVAAKEPVVQTVGVERTLPSSFAEDCSSSAEIQRLPAAPCAPNTPITQIDTIQALQYRTQTDEENGVTLGKTNQIQPHELSAGLVANAETEEKHSISSEYKSETGTNMELVGKEESSGIIVPQPPSQICFTASSSSVPQSSVGFKVQDSTETEDVEQVGRDLLVDANQIGHIPGAVWQVEGHQDLDSKPSPLSLPSSDTCQVKQTDPSKTQVKIIQNISNDANELQKNSSLDVVETTESVKAPPEPFNRETQLTSLENPETLKREILDGIFISSETAGKEDGRSQKSSEPTEGGQLEGSTEREQADMSAILSDFKIMSTTQDSSSKPSVAPSVFDTGIVVTLQEGQVVEAETSHSFSQLTTTETPIVAALTEAQEIVVVREGSHISEDWSNIHLNQSYILQREDGSVCEAAIVNELTAEPKLFEERVQSHLELDSHPVEVYEFCGLVEEVAEETVCASNSTQIPHSPGYEVNLFNALLENSDEYTVKQDIEMHIGSSFHTINDGSTVIISQQPLHSSNDENQIEVLSNSNSHTLSMQNPRVAAAVRQHLLLDGHQAVQVANSGEVCLVEVAAVTSDSFTVEQMGTGAHILASCSQVSAPLSSQTVVSASSGIQSISPKLEIKTTANTSLTTVTQSPVAVSSHAPHLENTEKICLFTHEGTKEPTALSVTLQQNVHSVAVSTETKPVAFCTTHSPSIINPKLLLLKPVDSPILKTPPSLLAQVPKQQGVSSNLTNAHGSRSGTASKECLTQIISMADSSNTSVVLNSQRGQTQSSVNKTSATEVLSEQTASSKCDKEALTLTKTSPRETAAQDGVSPTSATHTHGLLEVEDGDVTSNSFHDPLGQSDSLFVEDECEDMDQDEVLGETEAQEDISGHASSAEEDGSDDDPDEDKTESEMTTPTSSHKHGQSRTEKRALFLKVRQWIANRASLNSSPVSPSAGPSPNSDWSARRRERSSPLRDPHGKFVSPSSLGGYSSSSDQSTPRGPRGHADMAELAKHEADIEHRTQALKREGFWSMKRLTRLTEPMRPKVHWDYLCEEMQWLSADFAQERRWKRGVARKVVRMVVRHHEELRQKEEKAKRDEHAKIRKVASSIAKEVRAFWSNVEKVVQYKQQSRLEEKRKKALDLQLDFIVGQTEKYSDLLSKSLAPTRPAETVPPSPQKSVPAAVEDDDRDFEPPCDEEDDEETIEVEEQQEGNDAESHRREIELLKEEGMLPLDQLLSTLKLPQDAGSEEESSGETSSSGEEDEEEEEEEDGEFTANEEDANDEEDTIAAQEKIEGNVDHAEELDDLAKEGNLSIEELLERYKGAFASDFEVPSESGSKASLDSEASGDEEVETEEDESDVESNTSSSDSPGDSAEEDNSEKEDEESEEEEDEDNCEDEGMELLLEEGDHSPGSSGSRPKKEISHIAATAESLQPKGYTLATTKVKTPIPFLLHGTLREYQHIGLDWLVTMYEKKLNGILADEMGLGKTIQTIALLAHLACEKGNWGPHLIIVPTSVMLNWEMELKRWCPGFKILTYFGSQKERKLKRQGWTKPNAFHVCITSYKLVLQDHQAFRRKSWRYLILDEAQNIKNFKSQRWQSLLNFNSHRRLLLTGTPLQNSLMELWSLMHFLMPHVFQSHREFKEWFSNPLTGMIEGSQEYNEGLVKRLHKVLRPFLLRRIKADVEKQMPKKYEHVVRCRLSKRQRFLYDDFMAQASTRETLASGHFMSVINILMQLRKVCNHPNLFDPRPIQSPFITQPIVFNTASLVQDALDISPLKRCDLAAFDLVGLERRVTRYQADVFLPRHKVSRQLIQEIMESPEPPPRLRPVRMKVNRMFQPPPKSDNRPSVMNKPTCSVPPAPTPKPPPIPEASPSPGPAPVVQQVVCSVTPTPPSRPTVQPNTQTAVRSTAPKPVLTVRPPAAPSTAGVPVHPSPNNMPQRVLLSPDMQARLPSGEVVSIAQLASLAGRPVSSCQGSKPVTFQLQGNKLTLSGAQIHQVSAAPPRPVQGNVMHIVSSGVQHHLISQPAPLAVQSPVNANPANTSSSAAPANRLTHNASAQVPSSMVSSAGVVKIVVRQSAGKEGGPVPTLAVAPSPRVTPSLSLHAHANTIVTPVRSTGPLQIAQRTPGPATAHYTIAPPRNPTTIPNQPQPPRPVLKVVQTPPSVTEKPAPANPSSTPSKPVATPRDSSNSQTPVTMKSKPSAGAKVYPPPRKVPHPPPRSPFHMPWLAESHKKQHDSRLDLIFRVNEQHCAAKPVYGQELLNVLSFLHAPCPTPAPVSPEGEWKRSGHSACLLSQFPNKCNYWSQSRAVRKDIHDIEERLEMISDVIDRFAFVIPPVEAPQISMHCCHPPPSLSHKQAVYGSMLTSQVTPLTRCLHRIQCNTRTQFPDLRLIQYDCGKLQTLHTLLRKLKTGGHRVLIFTQMTRMLDVLEQFLNYHGHIYLRLDGSTRVEQRQALMERFNADRRIFCFILSTRSGGVGVNLTGADTVVFYDSDWNPTMDAQAQDRCHRIGQTRDVHIYRLISERTVEENILKKANQKRMLGDMAIEGGNFTTAFFKQQTIRELFDVNDGEKREVAVELALPQPEEEEGVNKQSTTILEQALCRAEDEEDIVAASQAKAEQVAELAEFNENIPLDDGGEQEEVEELSKAEQEIAALVEQLTPIERYAMNFLEASLEDVCKEELKQAEEQVEAARKGLDQAKEEGLKLHASSDDDDDDFLSSSASVEPAQPTAGRRGRKPKDKDKIVTSTRTSGRLRGASPEIEPESTTPKEVPERLRLRGRGAAASNSPSRSDIFKGSSSTSKSSKASSPARDNQSNKTRTLSNRSHTSPVPSPPAVSLLGGKQHSVVESETKSPKAGTDPKDGQTEGRPSESSPASTSSVDHHSKDDESKDHSAMSPPSTGIRSPRKRQSADGEVLRGLVEDSPSAKVLRKLPGRLVTVVEEKEPKKRRRRGSGTGGGGSSEDTTVEETLAGSGDEPNHNNSNTSPNDDGKAKEALNKSPHGQDTTPKSPIHPPPVRAYPPYSPPHLSPDMPVLRNLPVRRRLETESRMAAQLGEQQHLGRGRGATLKKTDTSKDATSTSTESGVLTPLKRKRGRPPKTVLKLPESDNTVTSPQQATSPSEDENPSSSSKPKKGRLSVLDTVSEEQSSKHIDSADASDVLKMDHGKELSEISTADPLSISQATESTTSNQTDKVQGPAPVSATDLNKPLDSTTKATEDLVSVSEPPITTVTISTTALSQIHVLPPASLPSSNATSTQVSATPSASVTLPDTAALTTTSSLPTVSTGSSSPSAVEPATFTSAAHVEPKPADGTAVKTELDAAKTQTVSTSVAAAPPTETLKASPAETPVPDPIVISSTASVASEAISKVTAASTTSATGKVSTQVTEQLSSIATSTSIPGLITSSPEESSTPPSTNSTTTVPMVTATAVETVQAFPSSSLVNTALEGQPTVADSSLTSVSAEVTSSVDTTPSSLFPTGTNIPSQQLKTLQEETKTVDTTVVSSAAQSVDCISPHMCAQNVDTSEAKLDEVILSSASTDHVSVEEESTFANTVTSPEKTIDTPSPMNTTTDATRDLQVSTTPSSEMLPTSASTAAVETSQVTSTTPPPASVTTTTDASTKTDQSFITSPAQNSSGQPSLEVLDLAQSKSLPQMPISAPSNVSLYKPSTESVQEEPACKSDLDLTEIQTETLETNKRTNEEEEGEDAEETEDEDDAKKQGKTKSKPKRRRLESSSVTKQVESEREDEDEGSGSKANLQEEAEQSEAEETIEDQVHPKHKRSLSRQSSQESTCSSSPSSGASTSALTRHSHHKRTYENRHPVKKRRMEGSTEAASEKQTEEGKEDGSKKALSSSSSQKRRSRSSSSSSDSDDSKGKKEHRLTRSAKQRKVQDQEKERGNARSGKKPAHSSDRNASSRANTSTGGESGSDTSSVRVTRKSLGSQSSQDGKSQLKSSPPAPAEPEVLGKRCSALNAAAKLLAMKGRVDTPGHTPRKDSAAKSAGTTPASSSTSPDKNQKPKNKNVPASSQTNSVTNNKGPDTKPVTTTTQSSRSPSRSTRQCPGSLVPPLNLEFKRSRPEKKERGSRKVSRSKEGEADAQSSSRGHSACSSMSSDGEADVGGRSSRSRSSSNSSQRTHSISSRVMEHKESGSLATSSGSERDTDRSSDRAKIRDKREKQGQKMDSGRDRRRSQKLSQEVTNSSGTEGTPDRVLRSVAALAAVQARSPAASTRSSSSQLQRNKT